MSDIEKLKVAEEQIQKLANFIMDEVPGEPSQSEGAVDCAIRVIGELTKDSELRANLDNTCEMNAELANYLIGRLATLADASIENERQVKAFKDALKSIVWDVEKERAERTGMKELKVD